MASFKFQTRTQKQHNLRSGKWTVEESLYADIIVNGFHTRSLDTNDKDVDMRRISLRGYLALKLKSHVKSISKIFESTGYNGKQLYILSTSLS